MKKFVLLIVLFGCFVSLQAQNYQEVVYLKNGSIIRGMIIEQQPNVQLKIQTADGSVFVYPIEYVEKISKEIAVSPRQFKSGHRNMPLDIVGYRGFVEVGTIVNFRASGVPIERGTFSFATSHGYQFNPYCFLGAGVGLDYHVAGGVLFFPVFADFRANFLNRAVTPFFGVKAGFSVGKLDSDIANPGAYFNPTFGVRFMPNKVALNLALGYNMQHQIEAYDYFFVDGVARYHIYGRESYLLHGLSLRLGVEF